MIELQYISIFQKELTFYISVADASQIVNSINVNRRSIQLERDYNFDILNIEDNLREINDLKIGKGNGLQRELVSGKVNKISEYLRKELGLLPNSIILNIEDPLNLVEFTDGIIVIPDDKSILITALDGQHRIEGLKEYLKNNDEKYQIPLTIFYNTELEFQAYLFGTINSTQTKINKSFLYDLLSLNKNEVGEFKLAHEIAYWLNSSPNSVLRENIKLLGKGPGWLSQAAFIDYLFPNIYLNDKKDNSNVIFKHYMKKSEYNKIALFLNDYFKAIIDIYKEEFYSTNYIFRTSFIFGVFMRLMPYAFIYSLNFKTFDYDPAKLFEIINWIKGNEIDFKKGGVNSGVGSSGKQTAILNEILSIFKKQVDIDSLVNEFRLINK